MRLSLVVAEAGGAREVALHVLAAPLVDDLASHRIADVGRATTGRHQVAAHVVHALPEHDLDHVQTLVEHDDVERLPGGGNPYCDFLVIHQGIHLWRTKA